VNRAALTGIGVALAVGGVAFITHPVLTVLVVIVALAAAAAWAWNRTTIGHRELWANERPTWAAWLGARFRGAPIGAFGPWTTYNTDDEDEDEEDVVDEEVTVVDHGTVWSRRVPPPMISAPTRVAS
jgi:hypothetical protein